MSAAEFRSRYREDGSLDPQCLEEMGRHWLRKWLERRFTGLDPWFPLDKKWDEDPGSLVVHILRDAGAMHPLAVSISYVFLEMLEEARKLAPATPPAFHSILSICQQVYLPQTSGWFGRELAALSQNPEAAEVLWGGYDVVKEILYAAARQVPGVARSAAHEGWLALLRTPRYATMALLGLARSFEQAAPYLSTWWESCPPEERQRELDNFLFLELKDPGDAAIRETLRNHGHTWPKALREAIDLALKNNGAKEFFANEAWLALEVVKALRSIVVLAVESLPDREYVLLAEAYGLETLGLAQRAVARSRIEPEARKRVLAQARHHFLGELSRLLIEAGEALDQERVLLKDILGVVQAGDVEKTLDFVRAA